MRIDLHVHSDYSDGSMTPAELVREAAAGDIAAIALTDHDTIAGVAEAVDAGKAYGVRVIPGIEVSAVYKDQDIHILGLNIDSSQPAFCQRLESYRLERDRRNREMISLMEACGLPINQEDFFAKYPKSVITRAHFAEYLLQAGAVASMKEAFDRYINPGRPCYLPKKAISCQEAISCILLGNGHPVLAHPWQYQMDKAHLEALVRELIGYGLQGLEAIYSTHTEGQERELRRMAAHFNLQISGGSDFHGSKKPDIRLGVGRGSLYVHPEVMNWLL